MDQATISRRRAWAERRRKARRLIWVLPAAFGAAVLGLQQAGIWANPPALVIWAAVVSGVLSVLADGVVGIFRDDKRSKAVMAPIDRMKTLVGAAALIQEETGIPISSIGISFWVLHTPRRSPGSFLRKEPQKPHLWRVERFRVAGPASTGDAWPITRGVIGECVRQAQVTYRDYRPLHREYPRGGPPLSNTEWKAVCKRNRDDGFERTSFVEMVNRYEQVMAYPISNGAGPVVGVVSIDVAPQPQAAGAQGEIDATNPAEATACETTYPQIWQT